MRRDDVNKPGAHDATLDADVLAELLSGIAPIDPPPSLRTRVLAAIGAVETQAAPAARRAPTPSPAAFAPVLLRDREGWRELVPGIRYKLLFIDPAANCKSFLLQADAGVSMPPHPHTGFEECLVLEGSFTMGDLTLRAGDYHAVSANETHDTASTDTGVVVYIRASMADYPMITAA